MLLVDTNIILHADNAPHRISSVLDALADGDVLFSPVVAIEIAVKVSIGRLRLSRHTEDYVERAREAFNARWLPITGRHAAAVADLPLHHRDPFDRLLVATAKVEGLTLVTTNTKLTVYDVDILVP